MREFTVLVLLALLLTAGTAFAVSQTDGEKAQRETLKENILAQKKLALGSSACGGDLTGLPDNREGLKQDDGDVGGQDSAECPSCVEDLQIRDSVIGGDLDEFCLKCCVGQIIKVDVASERLGAPTDLTLKVADSQGTALLFDDDGRGLSGVSTDPCLIFECPADGEYSVIVSNLADPAAGHTEAQSVYNLNVDILCDGETEPNDSAQPGNLNCPEDMTGEIDYSGLIRTGKVQGTIGGPSGDVDCFNVCLDTDHIFKVETDCAECDDLLDGDQVDPVLTLSDAAGLAVAFDDDTDDLDPGLVFRADAPGQFTLCLSDASVTNPGVYDLTWFIDEANPADGINCGEAAGICPCNGFKNHGGYVVCIVRWAKGLLRAGEITHKEYRDLVSEAAQSDCSQPSYPSGKGDHDDWDGELKNKDIPKP